MKFSDLITLAKAGYKVKDIERLEQIEKDEQKEIIEKVKTDESLGNDIDVEKKKDSSETESEENNTLDIMSELEDFKKELAAKDEQIKALQLDLNNKSISSDKNKETIEDIIKDFCSD